MSTAYSPTEGPAVRPLADWPRLIVAVIRTTDYTDHRVTDSAVTLACHSHDLDPEWRAPIHWLDLMLGSDKGKAVRADWAWMADHAHADDYSVSVWVDGSYIFDLPGRDIAAEFDDTVTAAEKAVLNP